MDTVTPAQACEMLNKRRIVPAALLLLGLLTTVRVAEAQVPLPTPVPESAPADAHDDAHPPADEAHAPQGEAAHADDDAHGAADDHGAAGGHGDDGHGESPWVTLARVANFAILAGGLFYFLSGPISRHLNDRGAQIRGDLERAAATKAEAARRLADIEQRLAGLPAELELVKQRGADEVAAEEARMARQAEIERERLVAQARREIDQQVRTARQALQTHAAALAVGVAETRLRATLTDSEQERLADTFAQQIGRAR